jgi:hypothetical protein
MIDYEADVDGDRVRIQRRLDHHAADQVVQQREDQGFLLHIPPACGWTACGRGNTLTCQLWQYSPLKSGAG